MYACMNVHNAHACMHPCAHASTHMHAHTYIQANKLSHARTHACTPPPPHTTHTIICCANALTSKDDMSLIYCMASILKVYIQCRHKA